MSKETIIKNFGSDTRGWKPVVVKKGGIIGGGTTGLDKGWHHMGVTRTDKISVV